MQKQLMVMDSSGDTKISFDAADVEAKATQEARELFDRLTGQGAAVFVVGGDGGKVTSFDELAAENVIVPRIVGG